VLPEVNTYFEPEKQLDAEKIISRLSKQTKSKPSKTKRPVKPTRERTKMKKPVKPTKGWLAIDTHTDSTPVGFFETEEEAIEEYVKYLFMYRDYLVEEVTEKFEKEFGISLDEENLSKFLKGNDEKRDFLMDELVPTFDEAKIGELYSFYEIIWDDMRGLYKLLNMILKGEFGVIS
jgi:hypothetical protein